jgi:HSP20 family molecular chaperone IbpA
MKQFPLVLCLFFSTTFTQAQVARTAPPAKSAAMTEEELRLRERRARALNRRLELPVHVETRGH